MHALQAVGGWIIRVCLSRNANKQNKELVIRPRNYVVTQRARQSTNINLKKFYKTRRWRYSHSFISTYIFCDEQKSAHELKTWMRKWHEGFYRRRDERRINHSTKLYKTHPGFNFQIMSYTLYIVSFLRPSFVCFTHAHLYTEWQQVAEGRAQFIITGTEEDYVVVTWRYEFDRVTII